LASAQLRSTPASLARARAAARRGVASERDGQQRAQQRQRRERRGAQQRAAAAEDDADCRYLIIFNNYIYKEGIYS
jgi:hypothetical protein